MSVDEEKTVRDLIKQIKEKADGMKFSSSAEQFVEIYMLLEELMTIRQVSKNQVDIKLKRTR
jgi:hypothetical protein